jgi:cytochrome c oxidase subunit 1
MHYIGIAGFPRRYYAFTALGNNVEAAYTDLNMFISIAAILTFSSQAIFFCNFFYSIFKGKKATQNPWNSNTLEWTTPIEPGHGNWEGDIPAVYRWPYDYSKPGSAVDFIPQNVPHSATPESNLPEEEEEIAKEKEIDGLLSAQNEVYNR